MPLLKALECFQDLLAPEKATSGAEGESHGKALEETKRAIMESFQDERELDMALRGSKKALDESKHVLAAGTSSAKEMKRAMKRTSEALEESHEILEDFECHVRQIVKSGQQLEIAAEAMAQVLEELRTHAASSSEESGEPSGRPNESVEVAPNSCVEGDSDAESSESGEASQKETLSRLKEDQEEAEDTLKSQEMIREVLARKLLALGDAELVMSHLSFKYETAS